MSGYIVQMISISAFLCPFYLILRKWAIRHKGIHKNMPREIFLGIFSISMTALAMLALRPGANMPRHMSDIVKRTIYRLQTGEGINLVPFRTVKLFYDFQLEAFLINIVGNIVLFMPIGFCVPVLYPRWRKAWKMIYLALAIPLCIETIQLFINRSTDIDDVMMNFAGIMLGYVIYRIMGRIR
jgi:glycopeptide antibiotics resistance protein